MSTTIELPDLAVSQPTSPSPPPSTHHTFGEDKGAGREAPWVRPALIALLVITAFAYLWDLSASGYANSFYAAAVQAGTKSWKAFFFGSIDSSNFITVDKPPASLWVMELSGRIFGFSSWSMLAPQALAGVASVGILYATVKRWFGAPAGLLAGAVLALTPVAALMFRYNNPDTLLVLLLVASAYTLTRALEKAGTRWLVATGALLGFAFLAKMMQAFTVVPAFYFVYLLAAPTSLARRIKQLVVCTGALAVAGGWWVMTVALWPVGSRPMIDGSPDNSIWNLIFDYNGFGRLVSSGAGGSGGGFSGATGVFRLFNDLMGGQASWLLPAALLALVTGLVVRLRAAAHRSYEGGGPAVGRVAGRDRRGIQLRTGSHPHLLHRCACPSRCRAGGHRRGPALAVPPADAGPGHRSARNRGHSGMELRAAQSIGQLCPVAADRGAWRRRPVGRRSRARPPRHTVRPPFDPCMGRPRPDRLLSRAGRIRWHDGDDRLHRERAVGGARRHVRRHRRWAPRGW